ncbi:hypothetical protein V1264_014188 [Littorina saxatilis]|uniref:UBA domain-containing protein n=1 Tax=Littorina saxatilis TaxID=31220 RepID=A0AAN9BRI7_9CAEN
MTGLCLCDNDRIVAGKPGYAASGAQPPTRTLTVDDMIAAVTSMGFELEDAQDAMRYGKMSTQEAVDWILAGKPGYAASGPQPPTRKLVSQVFAVYTQSALALGTPVIIV